MNIKSASGFPTPKTVCVREQARCAHFVQAHTRSRIGSSNFALSSDGCSRRSASDVRASRSEAATGCSACNRASTFFDAFGKRSFVSRIFSSAAITKSRAGSVICSDRAKFCAQPQTICATHSRNSSDAKTHRTPKHCVRNPSQLLPFCGSLRSAHASSRRFSGLVGYLDSACDVPLSAQSGLCHCAKKWPLQ